MEITKQYLKERLAEIEELLEYSILTKDYESAYLMKQDIVDLKKQIKETD